MKTKLENTEFAVELSSNKQSIYSGMLKTMRQTVETKSLKKKNVFIKKMIETNAKKNTIIFHRWEKLRKTNVKGPKVNLLQICTLLRGKHLIRTQQD